MPANLAHIAKKAYKQSNMEKMQPSSSRSVFSLLHVDLDPNLERKHPNVKKERRMRIGERVATSCGAPFNKSKGKTSPPKKGSIFGVLELKTRKMEKS
jgi:hypothetical protein